MQSLALNTEVAFRLYGRHLEKSILRHNSAGDRLLLLQNHMPLEFQYGDRPFSQTGCSFFSTVN